MTEAHCPDDGQMIRCKVRNCNSSQKPRGALICHFKEKHCQPVRDEELEKQRDFKVNIHAMLFIISSIKD